MIGSVGMKTDQVPKVTIRVQNQDELINGNPAYAHYHPPGTGSTHEIHFGDGSGYSGRNNPTKEAAVIAHEYMHRVSETYNSLDQSGGNPTGQPDAMDKAYSDYFAVGYTNQFFSDSEIGEYAIPNEIRDLDNSNTFSDYDPINGSHANSVIFSGSLWDVRNDIGASTADGAILQSLDLLDNSPSFLDARNTLKAAAPSQYSDEIDDAFAAHRIPLLTAYIWGPGLVYPNQQNTWTAGADGDLGSISYQWYIKYQGSSTWTYLGSGSSVTQTFTQPYSTHQFKLDITSNGQSAEDIQTVVVWGGRF